MNGFKMDLDFWWIAQETKNKWVECDSLPIFGRNDILNEVDPVLSLKADQFLSLKGKIKLNFFNPSGYWVERPRETSKIKGTDSEFLLFWCFLWMTDWLSEGLLGFWPCLRSFCKSESTQKGSSVSKVTRRCRVRFLGSLLCLKCKEPLSNSLCFLWLNHFSETSLSFKF